MNSPKNPPTPVVPQSRLWAAYKIICVLGALVIAFATFAGWSWLRRGESVAPGGLAAAVGVQENLIRKKFPEVDFTAIYPGLSASEIDQLQRDCLGLRYVYAPFVEFAPLPVKGRFVNVTSAGYREGRASAAWPPSKQELVVFVFGGSTTFGYGLPDAQTVVSGLEEKLSRQFPGLPIRCYNFGRGYYFSTQERQLFQTLLSAGYVPDAAVFIDGLNDFVYYDGVPQLAPTLFAAIAADLPAPRRAEPVTELERAAAVEQMIFRYAQNLKLTEASARAFGVIPIFVGQPVPFSEFPMNAATYPFATTYAEHQLAGWGYGRFKQAAQEGRFGQQFIWCGDAFARANRVMYADSIHYSPAGAELLAETIVRKITQANLLPTR